MAERPVVNASPIIFLSRARLLDLLLEAGPALVVPAAVEQEIAAFGATDPVLVELRATPWLEVVSPVAVPQSIASWDLGAGESAVLAWALAHTGAEAILDDLGRAAEAPRCERGSGGFDSRRLPHPCL